MTATAPATAARPAEIHGLVDSATPSGLFGWAWNAARPEERVAVELRLADVVVATVIADRERSDLGKAGIGDGRHAFDLPLRPDWVRRRAELSVVVITADGAEALLAIRIPRSEAEAGVTVEKVVEATTAAHRELREDLDRLARRLPPEGARLEETLRDIAAGQSVLNERLETLSLWLTRLDARLAELPTAAGSTPRPPRRVDAWQMALGAVLGVVLLGACIASAALLRMAG